LDRRLVQLGSLDALQSATPRASSRRLKACAPFFINGNNYLKIARSSWTQVQLRRTVRTSLLNAKEDLKRRICEGGHHVSFSNDSVCRHYVGRHWWHRAQANPC